MKPTCGRCGTEITGMGKTGLCQPCARTLQGRIQGKAVYRRGMTKPTSRKLVVAMREDAAATRNYAEPSLPKFSWEK